MIVLDGEYGAEKTDSPFAGRTVRLPDQVTLRSTTSLPDYDASQQEHQVFQPVKTRKRRFGSNFWKPAACAFVLYVALSLAIGLPLVLIVSLQCSSCSGLSN